MAQNSNLLDSRSRLSQLIIEERKHFTIILFLCARVTIITFLKIISNVRIFSCQKILAINTHKLLYKFGSLLVIYSRELSFELDSVLKPYMVNPTLVVHPNKRILKSTKLESEEGESAS